MIWGFEIKSQDKFDKKMRRILPQVVIERARQAGTKIVVWDPIKQKVAKLTPDQMEQVLKDSHEK